MLAANGTSGLLSCAPAAASDLGSPRPTSDPAFADLRRRGRLRRVGDGTNLIDTVYVENAATAQPPGGRRTATRLARGRPSVFHQPRGAGNCWAWINQILVLAGLPPVQKSLSPAAAWTFGAAWEAVYSVLRLQGQPPMSRFLTRQMAASHYFNITRARENFGYRPNISMAEGMARLAAALQGA